MALLKYLLILCTLFSLTTYAQSYETQLAKHRQKYKEDFLKDANSPLKKKDLTNLNFYPADSTLKVQATVELLNEPSPFKMLAHGGTSSDYIRYAKLTFALNQQDFVLYLYASVMLSKNPTYKNHLFLPFTDETNGTETYGAGRYLDLDKSAIKNSTLEVDFNLAYNPYCAYSNAYNCPIPPKENKLSIEIKAGEKNYSGKVK
ncbi:DUF1684 domain-containing protein [Pedobacter sp. MW01-1-1]|uniref:DUF1684 domain-containing protein n=1 Tax=Pedobacter sp. MW01-1-1 TaxID=3383027 RepID=UPI003FEF46D1